MGRASKRWPGDCLIRLPKNQLQMNGALKLKRQTIRKNSWCRSTDENVRETPFVIYVLISDFFA
jgi:hypothetical protein